MYQRGPTGGPRTTSGPRLLVIKPVKFLNFVLVLLAYLSSLLGKILKISILISTAALYTSATHATDFKTMP
jgi:hypothetical protein